MRASQTRRHGELVPHVGGANHIEIVWELGAVTQRTVQRSLNTLRPCDVVQYPGGRAKGWVMANVLAVEAVELRYPIAGLVVHEADDSPLHVSSVEARSTAGLKQIDSNPLISPSWIASMFSCAGIPLPGISSRDSLGGRRRFVTRRWNSAMWRRAAS